MDPNAMSPALEAATCRLIGLVTNYPLDALSELDLANHVKPLVMEIDPPFFGENLALADLSWYKITKELEVFLEGLEIFDGLDVGQDGELDSPSSATVLSLLLQILAIHWLAVRRLDQELDKLEPPERELMVASLTPLKSVLAEGIAYELINERRDKALGGVELQQSGSIRRDSAGSTVSATNRILMTKVNDRDRQLDAEIIKIRKMEEYMAGLKSDLDNAFNRNEELVQEVSLLTAENQRLKTEQRYQRNKQAETEAALERERADRDKLAEERAAVERALEKAKREMGIYIEKEAEYTNLLTLQSNYTRYMEERALFIQAKSDMMETIHDLVAKNEDGRARMDDLSRQFSDQAGRLTAESAKVVKLQEENLVLAAENQQLRVEVASFGKHFDNENLSKRKQNETKTSRSPGHSDDADALKQQIKRMQAEVAELRRQREEDKRNFQSELEGALEVHQRQVALLEAARIETENANRMVDDLRSRPTPPIAYVAAAPPRGDMVDSGTQLGPELIERREIETSYLVYSAVMEFTAAHMEHFRDSRLKAPAPRGLANFLSCRVSP